jgi:hypothetical protein
MGLFGRDERLWPTRDAYYGGENKGTSRSSAGGGSGFGSNEDELVFVGTYGPIIVIATIGVMCLAFYLHGKPSNEPKPQPKEVLKEKIQVQTNAADISIGEGNHHHPAWENTNYEAAPISDNSDDIAKDARQPRPQPPNTGRTCLCDTPGN